MNDGWLMMICLLHGMDDADDVSTRKKVRGAVLMDQCMYVCMCVCVYVVANK